MQQHKVCTDVVEKLFAVIGVHKVGLRIEWSVRTSALCADSEPSSVDTSLAYDLQAFGVTAVTLIVMVFEALGGQAR